MNYVAVTRLARTHSVPVLPDMCCSSDIRQQWPRYSPISWNSPEEDSADSPINIVFWYRGNLILPSQMAGVRRQAFKLPYHPLTIRSERQTCLNLPCAFILFGICMECALCSWKTSTNWIILYFSIFWGRIFDKSDLAEFLGPSFCKDPEPSWAARGPQMSWSNRECRWQVVLGHQIPRASRGSSGRRRYQWSRWMRLGHGETSLENPILIILIQSERMLINAN